jgi:hypothetical protein
VATAELADSSRLFTQQLFHSTQKHTHKERIRNVAGSVSSLKSFFLYFRMCYDCEVFCTQRRAVGGGMEHTHKKKNKSSRNTLQRRKRELMGLFFLLLLLRRMEGDGGLWAYNGIQDRENGRRLHELPL